MPTQTPSPWIDLAVLVWMVACWVGYARFADRRGTTRPSLRSAMLHHRQRWMEQALRRENRVSDAALIGNLMRSVAFFASTTILILAGLVAVLGASADAMDLMSDIPWVVRTSRTVLEMKVLVLATVFIYGFFKFTWSLRQFNYACVLLGGLPAPDALDEESETQSRRTADLLSLAGENFNRGLRAYYFGLGTLSWFIHPLLFALVCAWMIQVLYRREFRSNTLRALASGD